MCVCVCVVGEGRGGEGGGVVWMTEVPRSSHGVMEDHLTRVGFLADFSNF